MLKNIPIAEYVPTNIVEDVEILSKLKSQQLEQLSIKKQFTRDHDITVDLYNKYNCDTYIDFGCWAGVDSHLFYKTVRPTKTILIDAVPTYLKFAKELFDTEQCENVFVNELLLLVRTDIETWPGHFVLDIDATIDTSTVNGTDSSWYLKNKNKFKMPTATPENILKAAPWFKEEINNSRCLLKTDLDGLDHHLLKAMLNCGIRPHVIKFEMFTINDGWKSICKEFLEICKNAGYAVPPLEAWCHPSSSMSNFYISKNHWVAENHGWTAPNKIHNGYIMFIARNF